MTDATAGAIHLETRHQTRGRAVLVRPDGTLYAARNLTILRSRDDGASWERVAALPRDPLRAVFEASRLACRLLRHEVRALAELDDGTLVAANRRGVFHGRPGDALLAASHCEAGAWPVLPPLCLGVGPGMVLFGEYASSRGRPMRILASRDAGRHFEVVHTFAAGEILHVHNVVYDAGRDHYWVLTGDFDAQVGIGQLSSDLRRFEWLVRGEQRHRAVDLFDAGDHLVYATDTQLEANSLIRLDKRTGRTERGQPFEGSCIYACRFGGWFALTTTVEPSRVNPSRDATLWVSRDLERWQCALRARKDRWNADYFQFGSLVLPRGSSGREVFAVSGQALARLDGRLSVGSLEPGAAS